MIPRFVYGDSYGDVGNRELATDAARDSRYFNILAANRAQQQIEDQKRTGDEQLGLQYANMAQQGQNQNANLNYQYASMGQNANLFKDQLDNQRGIAMMQMAAQQQLLGKADTDKFYNEAYSGITNGSIATPEELNAFAGDKLTPEQKSHLTFYIDQAGRERSAAYKRATDAAAALNADYDRRIAPLTPGYAQLNDKFNKAPDVTSLNWLQRHVGWVAPTTKEDLAGQLQRSPFNTERSNFMAEVEKNKALSGLVAVDPTTGKFMPSMPPPRGFVPPASSNPTGLQGGITPTGTPFLNPGSNGASNPSTWVSIPLDSGHTVRLDPRVAAEISTATQSMKNDIDKEAYTRQRVAQAVQSGQAQTVAPAPAKPSWWMGPLMGQ